MARIRTIKPEFPQSESMGRVSRDARLLFILLWTLCDDEGKLRGNSRMLASLLYPYDDGENGRESTSATDVDKWMTELEREGCIIRFKIEDSSYVSVRKWLNHQKIDKPSKSKIPEPEEHSRILANPRESSALDQGSEDQGSRNGMVGSGELFDAPKPVEQQLPDKPEKKDAQRATRLPKDWKPSEEDIQYCNQERPDLLPSRIAQDFYDYWISKPGKDGTKLDWSATWRTWVRKEKQQPQATKPAMSDKFNVAGTDYSSTDEAQAQSFAKQGIIIPKNLDEIDDIPF